MVIGINEWVRRTGAAEYYSVSLNNSGGVGSESQNRSIKSCWEYGLLVPECFSVYDFNLCHLTRQSLDRYSTRIHGKPCLFLGLLPIW